MHHDLVAQGYPGGSPARQRPDTLCSQHCNLVEAPLRECDCGRLVHAPGAALRSAKSSVCLLECSALHITRSLAARSSRAEALQLNTPPLPREHEPTQQLCPVPAQDSGSPGWKCLHAAVDTHHRMLCQCMRRRGGCSPAATAAGAVMGRCGMLSSASAHMGLSAPAASAQLLQTRGSTSRLHRTTSSASIGCDKE